MQKKIFQIQTLSSRILWLSKGESYRQLARFMGPEIITSLLLFSALTLVDAKLIADLGSHTVYASLGVATSLFHLLVKVGESFMAATVIFGGRSNGKEDFIGAGRAFVNIFWITLFLGCAIVAAIYVLAPLYYTAHHFEPEIIEEGATYLRLKAISIFLMFIYLSFAGFFKSIKNTKLPMNIFAMGAIIFIIFDYLLINGLSIFPAYGLMGSAIASIIQYSFMVAAILGYVLLKHSDSHYQIKFFKLPNLQAIKTTFTITWPVIIDKATLAIGYIWLGLMLATTGSHSLASYIVVRDILALVCIPSQAAAHVISFLASNDAGRFYWKHILINIQKITWLTIAIIFPIFLMVLYNANSVVALFDKANAFSQLAVWTLLLLSGLILGDILQMVLSGAMRGVGKVNYVMWVRMASIFGFFIPTSYLITKLPINNNALKFFTIYIAFYINFFLMAGSYLWLFKKGEWQLNNLEAKAVT